MCPGSAVRFGSVEVACICMRTEYHVTSSVDNASIGIRGHVVQKCVDKLFRAYCRFRLASSDGVKHYKQFVVHSSCIVEEQPDDLLDTQKAFGRECG